MSTHTVPMLESPRLRGELPGVAMPTPTKTRRRRHPGDAAASPAKVAFLASCVRGGGAGWSMYYLIRHLDRTKVEPLVIIPAPGIFGEHYAELGVEVVTPDGFPETRSDRRFPGDGKLSLALSVGRNLIDLALLVPRLAEILRSRGIEVLYCNNMRMHEIGVPAAWMAGIPAVLHARNIYDIPALDRVYRSLAGRETVHRVIANSHATAGIYTGHERRKVEIIHNGIDVTQYRSELIPSGVLRSKLGLSRDTTIIGYAGRIEPRKGIDVMIRAAARVLKTRAEVAFVVVGSVPKGAPADYRAEYERLAAELGIAEKVIFAGFRDDVRPATKDFDISCLPAFREPFGRVVIEAMALGKPVVACDAGGVPEIVTHGVDGLLVPPHDERALADAVGTLVDDEGLRTRMGVAARACARRRFDVAMLTRDIEKTLLAAARSGARK